MPPGKKLAAKPPSKADKVPYDPTTQEIILDLKGLSSVPYDQQTAGTMSFRALVMPKGKYVHEPQKAAKYLVLGSFRSITAFCLVKFDQSLNREPELLLNFVDCGLADANSIEGIMVETVQLPLMTSAGVFQKSLRTSTADDIVSFEIMDTTKDVRTKDLTAFLKTLDHFRFLSITSESTLLNYIAKSLSPRLETLVKQTSLDLKAHIDHLAVQDAEVAEVQHQALKVKLDSLTESFRALPPEAYDATLSTRITTIAMLDAPDHEQVQLPVWLKSPLKAALAQGTAMGERTSLAPRSFVRAEPATGGPSGAADAGSVAGEQVNVSDHNDDEDDEEDEEDDEEEEGEEEEVDEEEGEDSDSDSTARLHTVLKALSRH
jgi:hypothetical protein